MMSLSKLVLFSLLFGNLDTLDAAKQNSLRGAAKSRGARNLETDAGLEISESSTNDDVDGVSEDIDLSDESSATDNNDDNAAAAAGDADTEVIELSEAETDLLDYVTNDHALDAARHVAIAIQNKCPQVTNEYTGELDIYDGSEEADRVPSDNACLLIIKEVFTEASFKFLRLASRQLTPSKNKDSKRNKRYLKKFGIAGLEAKKIPEADELMKLLEKQFMSVMEESKSALERGEKPQAESSRYVATRDGKKRKLFVVLAITIATFVGFKWAATAIAVMEVGMAVSELAKHLKKESEISKRQRRRIVRRAKKDARRAKKDASNGAGFGR